MMDKRKITLRIGRNSLSFATFNSSDATQPVIYEPYIVKAGIAMAVNLREAFKNVVASDLNHADVLLDTPQMLVPIEQFDEDDIKTLFDYAFPAKEQVQHIVRYNVLPDLKTVCLFAVNKDLNSVLNDRFDHVQYTVTCSFMLAASQMSGLMMHSRKLLIRIWS